MALPLGVRFGLFDDNRGTEVWPRSVWVSWPVFHRLMDRVRLLESAGTVAGAAKPALRAMLRSDVGDAWANEDDGWLYKVLGDFVDWNSGIGYLRTVFE